MAAPGREQVPLGLDGNEHSDERTENLNRYSQGETCICSGNKLIPISEEAVLKAYWSGESDGADVRMRPIVCKTGDSRETLKG